MGSMGHVCTGACAAGGGLTLSITHGILIQVGLCTELRTGVGDLYFWQRYVSEWIMTWFPSRFYSLLLLFVRLFPVALQDSCVAAPATLPVPFFNHTGKNWWFADGWASGLGHEAETYGISPFSQCSALGLGQGNLSLISKEPWENQSASPVFKYHRAEGVFVCKFWLSATSDMQMMFPTAHFQSFYII